jgi:two-component system chemotaxis response regulator CheB
MLSGVIGDERKPMREKDMQALRTEAAAAETPIGGYEALDSIASRATITCPDCGGVMWQLRDGHPLRFRCHTGHAFSGLALTTAEEALALARIRATQAKADGNHDAYQLEQSRIQQCERLLKVLHTAISV